MTTQGATVQDRNITTFRTEILVATILLLDFLALLISNKGYSGTSYTIDINKANSLGTLFSGLATPFLSLFAIYITYWTYITQHKAFIHQQIENNFFKMLDYREEIISKMSHRDPSSKNGETICGRPVFYKIRNQIDKAHKIVSGINYENHELSNIDKVIVSYIACYFGLGGSYKTNFTNLLIPIIKDEQYAQKIHQRLSQERTYYDEGIKYFGGHVSRLNLYFRNLYSVVNFIDQNEYLSDSQKQDYIHILRSQMTEEEQELLFINSLSDLGKTWRDKGLIKKYSLTKNIANSEILGVSPR